MQKSTASVERVCGRATRTLWTGGDEARWLGWLDAPNAREEATRRSSPTFAAESPQARASRTCSCSAWAARACAPRCSRARSAAAGLPRAARARLDRSRRRCAPSRSRVDLARTLVIVASKSGARSSRTSSSSTSSSAWSGASAREAAGAHFVAITDPGSQARRHREGKTASAASSPASRRSAGATRRCQLRPGAGGADRPRPRRASSARAAAWRARAARRRPRAEPRRRARRAARRRRRAAGATSSRSSPRRGIASLGAWLEQLDRRVDRQGRQGRSSRSTSSRSARPTRYGDDRVFVYVRLDDAPDARAGRGRRRAREGRTAGRRASTSPTRSTLGARVLPLGDRDRGRGRDPRHRSVRSARRRSEQDRDARADDAPTRRRRAAGGEAVLSSDGACCSSPTRERATRCRSAGARRARSPTFSRAHFAHAAGAATTSRCSPTSTMNAANDAGMLQRMRARVRDALRVATCLGFGPRFLHSTGQAYKGGPNSGVFLQITCDDAARRAGAGQQATRSASSRRRRRAAISQVLAERGRRALRVAPRAATSPPGLPALRAHRRSASSSPRTPPTEQSGLKLMEEDITMQIGDDRTRAAWARNMVRRLLRGGHEVVVWNRDFDEVRRSSRKVGATGATTRSRTSCKLAEDAARGVGDGAGRRRHRADGREARRAASKRATSSSTAATRYFKDDVRRAQQLAPKGIALRRRRHERRRVGRSSAATA